MDRKEIVHHDTQKYTTDDGIPLLVLLSKHFFDLMWKCSRKNDLLKMLSSEAMKGNKVFIYW